tara:strand:- start:4219 stop:4665 length:447 start_codon:yes stop_codon:yes gene_type:complete
MIEKGQLTVIDFNTYNCMKIEDGYAYLKDVTNDNGRYKKVAHELVPYFAEDGTFIVPEKPVLKKNNSRISVNQLVRNATDMPISRTFSALLHEWIEGAVTDMVCWAENNAKELNHKRISAKHIYWWELSANQEPNGHWPSQEEYIRKQ